MPASMPANLGKKYRVVEELGQGGFATVYRAVDTTLDREVAIKVLDPLLLSDPTFLSRFQREARAVARLNHPNIITIHEIGEYQELYDPTAIRHLEAHLARRPEPGQEGVSALLEGRKMDIKPEGFENVHRRGRQGEHRLSADAHKWQPYGVGEEEPDLEVETTRQ